MDSAGTWAQPGLPADPLTQKAAQSIDQGCEYDLIVVMEKNHEEILNAEFPERAGRTHLFAYLVNEIEDVLDPLGEELSFHLQMAKELVKLIAG